MTDSYTPSPQCPKQPMPGDAGGWQAILHLLPGEVVVGSMGGVCASSRESLSPSDRVEAVPPIALTLTCCLSSPGCAAACDVHPWMCYSPASLPPPLLLPGSLSAFAPSLPGIILTSTCIFLARSQAVPKDGLCLGILAFVHVIMSANVCPTKVT